MKFIIISLLLFTTPLAYAQRSTDQLVALYTFTEGSGSIVIDRMGDLDLTIESLEGVSWIAGGGLMINGPTRIESQTIATNIIVDCVTSNEVSIEMWIMPLVDTSNGPARIVSLGVDGTGTGGNFMFGQEFGDIEIRLRSTTTDKYGNPPLTAGGILDFSSVQHLVFTKMAGGTTMLYRNSIHTATSATNGDFTNWLSATLTIANESIDNRPWLGTIHLVAIYSKALSDIEVTNNYNAGYGFIIPDYNPEIDARVIWNAPIGGAYSYIIQHSINGEPWISYATSTNTAIDMRLTFFDQHRARVAGRDSLDRLGPYSESSDILLPADNRPHPSGPPIKQ